MARMSAQSAAGMLQTHEAMMSQILDAMVALGCWCADPLAALAMLPLIVREDVEALRQAG